MMNDDQRFLVKMFIVIIAILTLPMGATLLLESPYDYFTIECAKSGYNDTFYKIDHTYRNSEGGVYGELMPDDCIQIYYKDGE